ncbi:MAG TPA: 50S ribosomal protein L15 [Desulfobacteraceae bacterium]|nr:50S ribosomal protein L15 [Deltaproteobacteria bacterium]MBW2355368.1 50S ribosomal protein L15 [Deltaproteobacteria bacterium]HDI61096.1 50S ribosomal protein L15 [Desulfobacteraceae bacterium]
MKLNELKPAEGARRRRKRVGRGPGSGLGKTAGRGSKGSKARSGGAVSPGFEGGQMPLQRRLPKRGFTNIFKKTYAVVNLRDLARFEAQSTVDEAALLGAGLVKNRCDGIKLLAEGEIDRPLTVRLDRVSKAARAKIEAAGGTVEADAS